MNRLLLHLSRECSVWLFGTVVLPLSLVGFLVTVKGASFDSAVSGGELVALGIEIAGASIALELIIYPGALLTSIYRLGLLSILLGSALFFAGTAEVNGGRVTTDLSSGEVRTSIVLMGLAAMFGVAAVARQAWRANSRPQP